MRGAWRDFKAVIPSEARDLLFARHAPRATKDLYEEPNSCTMFVL